MSVLKGDLAIQQSMALIRLFKKMKDILLMKIVSCSNLTVLLKSRHIRFRMQRKLPKFGKMSPLCGLE